MPLSLYVFSRLIRQFQNSDISLTNQVQNLQAERPSARRTQTPPADASGLNSGRPQVPRPHGPFSIVALFVELPRAPHPSPAFLDGVCCEVRTQRRQRRVALLRAVGSGQRWRQAESPLVLSRSSGARLAAHILSRRRHCPQSQSTAPHLTQDPPCLLLL